MTETSERTTTTWRCDACRVIGELNHDTSTSIRSVVQLVSNSHQIVSPVCHRARGLTKVSVTLAAKSA